VHLALAYVGLRVICVLATMTLLQICAC